MDKRRINTRAIIWLDGKLLAVKHNKKDGGESDYWALPGGGLDPVEALVDGIKREIMEELGIEAHVGRLLFGQQFRSRRRNNDEELELFYLIENSQDFTTIDLSTTTHGAHEIARCEFINPATEKIYPEFLQHIDIQAYIDSVKPVEITDNLNEASV